MSLIFLLSLILLFGTSVWYVIFPLFEGRSKIPALVSREELERKKIVFLRQIKELEMDHHIGNITDKDYENYLATTGQIVFADNDPRTKEYANNPTFQKTASSFHSKETSQISQSSLNCCRFG